MMSRLVTRVVLVSIISAVVWSLWWTWTAEFQDIAQRVALMVLESSVLLAALSLLLESFRSFGMIAVKRGGWAYTLFGLYMFDEDRKTSSVNARTCELFGARSVVLSMLGIALTICLTLLYQSVKTVALFFLNPRVPAVNWSEALWFVGSIVIAIPVALLLLAGQTSIVKNVPNRVVRVLVSVFYWSMTFGLAIGTASIFEPSGFGNTPAYMVMLMGMGTALVLASFIGTVFSLAYTIYNLVGKMSQKFPVLGNVWNQLCPVQTVRFIE